MVAHGVELAAATHAAGRPDLRTLWSVPSAPVGHPSDDRPTLSFSSALTHSSTRRGSHSMESPHMSPDPPLLELIAADIDRYSRGSAEFQNRSASLIRRISILLTPSLMCCLLIRLAHAAHLREWRCVASSLSRLNALAHKIEVDPAASVGPGLYIPHPTGISCEDALVATHTCIPPIVDQFWRCPAVNTLG